MAVILLLQAGLLYAFSWICWKAFRQHFVKSALDNIPGPPAKTLWKGVFPQVFNVNAWDFHKEIADKYGSVIKIKALLGENQLFVFDPKAMHHIIVKDQHIYEETSSFIEGNKVVFGPGLLGTLGEQHRKQRKMLSPVFSTAHMREMVPIFYNVTYKLRSTLLSKVENGPQEIDMLHWMTRTALELIGQSGFGFSFDPLTEGGVAHPYSASVKQFIPVLMKVLFLRTYFFSTFAKIGSPKFRRWLIGVVPSKALHQLRDISDILHNTSIEVYESKKRALAAGDEAVAAQIGQGKDILSILMRANVDASEGDALTEEELLAQMSTLTFAAMDTTSSALSRILWLLSMHPDVQDKLRQEIIQARKQHGDLVYDDLVALPYLDAVCRETLRLYAPVSTVSRVTRQDAVLPLSKPIKGLDGQEIHEIAVPNNTNIIVSLMASNRNPDLWGPDSYEWKPERWLNPLPNTVIDAHVPGIYSHLMTFLGGGRACIGFKFSQLEMKVVLFLLVESLRFSPSKDKEIFWQMTGVVSPIVKSDNRNDRDQTGTPRPKLPLIVERI
ncbi:cytochrome P450 [Gymnopilus junonius]|uniref:Cytochrome P450 n=1 Tax=Gymnopilus junonius TaxID=109634 RepID=A0A9P5NPZ1_GYMJU|nr:cytochrome P450 [Gymnopilus junonius]